MSSSRQSRLAAVTVAVGLTVAAVTTGSGPYLRADREVVVRPLRLGERLRIGSFGRGGSEEGVPESLRRAGALVEVALAVVVAVVLLLVAAALLVAFARGLARVRLLRLRHAAVADAVDRVDPGDLADDEGITPLRRRLARELVEGERALDSGEAADVVVACYLALLDAVRRSGIELLPHETPTELLERVVASAAVSGEALRTLTELYREARYSRHVVDDVMRARARAALALLRADLDRPLVPR